MKAYVVTLMDLPDSVQVSNRCIESAKAFGLTVERRLGVWRDVALDELRKSGLKLGTWDQSWSNTAAVVGNFVAQYRIWVEIVESKLPGLILEHDAVVVATLPDLTNAGDIVTLGKPSFGRLKPQTVPGFYPLFSTGDKIPGAHGYFLTPCGAADLVAAARKEGAMPVDKFICPQRFPDIREYWPWPIEARDSFTTIQREKGCRSKHNYRDGYRIL
jgi:hypothetical protein